MFFFFFVLSSCLIIADFIESVKPKRYFYFLVAWVWSDFSVLMHGLLSEQRFEFFKAIYLILIWRTLTSKCGRVGSDYYFTERLSLKFLEKRRRHCDFFQKKHHKLFFHDFWEGASGNRKKCGQKLRMFVISRNIYIL